MSGPLMSLGLWDGTRTGQQIFDRLSTCLETEGARLEPQRALCSKINEHRHFASDGEPGELEVLHHQHDVGGLVELTWSIGSLDHAPAADWQPLLQEILDLILHLRPTLAVVTVEWPVTSLPDPDWEDGCELFQTGWIDLGSCGPDRKHAFEDLRKENLATTLGPGVWWSSWSNLSITADEAIPQQDELAARVFKAWTGQEAPQHQSTPIPAPSAEDLAPRALWFWSHQTPAESLLTRVEAVAGPRGLSSQTWDFGQEECWRFVMSLYEPQGRSLEKLLDDLRCALPVVQPSWAGLQPQSGFLMPGPDTDVPAVSIITHPWVSRDWIGEELPGLEEVLAGCHREEIAGGVLWITDPDLAPTSRFGEDWYDRHLRFERMASAADILGRAARRSVGRTS